jgi:hypothetical protein
VSTSISSDAAAEVNLSKSYSYNNPLDRLAGHLLRIVSNPKPLNPAMSCFGESHGRSTRRPKDLANHWTPDAGDRFQESGFERKICVRSCLLPFRMIVVGRLQTIARNHLAAAD